MLLPYNILATCFLKWYNMTNMSTDSAEGLQGPFIESETRGAYGSSRQEIQAQINAYQTRAKELVVMGIHSGMNQREWQACYDEIELLYDELAKLPAETEAPFDGVTSVDTVAQLAELYADDNALFPRLGEQAIADAFALLKGYPIVSEVLLGGGDKTIRDAINQMPSHRQDAFTSPDVLRGPVIFEENGSLSHIQNALAIRKSAPFVEE